MMQEDEVIYEAPEETPIIDESVPDVVEVEIFEAFQSPTAGDSFNHALLTNREIHDAHPITAVTGLREELDSIEALQTIYSDKKGNADYYEWADGHALGENGVGYFVTLNKDVRTISICAGDDIFGVVVDSAAFVGGQDDITRDEHYGLVVTSGAVHVRCELDVAEGDYVISNAYGMATTASSGRGYKVVALHDIKGVPHATINLNISADQVHLMGAELQDLDSRMDAAESNIISAVNVANEAYQKATNIDISNLEMSDKINDALGTVDRLEGEVENLGTQVSNSAVISAQAKAIAESAATSAESMKNEAVEKADEALADTADLRDELLEMGAQITDIEDQVTIAVNKATDAQTGVAGIRVEVDKYSASIDDLVSWQSDTNTAMARIEQKADANGAYIQSTVSNMDKYSVGPHSQAYGFTRKQATSVLEVGMIYVPTENGIEEEYIGEGDVPTYKRTFSKHYLYCWREVSDGYGWVTVDKNYTETSETNTSAQAVYFTPEEPAVSGNFGYWYTDGDTVTKGYEPYTLYKWESYVDENNSTQYQWIPVATLAGNSQSRAVSQIRQDANSIELSVTTLDNKYAGTKTWVDDNKSAIQATVTWKEENAESIATFMQEAGDNFASITQVAQVVDKDGNVTAASIVAAVNNDTSGVTIKADHINLDGAVITMGNLDDNAKGQIVTSSEIFYGLSDSAETEPTDWVDQTQWGTGDYVWTEGKYTWQKTKVTKADGNYSESVVCIQGAKGADGKPGTDGKAGADAYTVVLTNESHTFAGRSTNYAEIGAEATTQVIAFLGNTQKNATIVSVDGVAASTTLTNTSINSLQFQCSTLTAQSPTITFKTGNVLLAGSYSLPIVVRIDGKEFTKTFSCSVARQGGSSTIRWIVASDSAIHKTADGACTPDSITLTAKSQTGGGSITSFNGAWKILGTTNGDTYESIYESTVGENEVSITHEQFASYRSLKCQLFVTKAFETLSDEQTIPIVSDGAAGDNVTSVEQQYCVSTSATSCIPLEDGGWESLDSAMQRYYSVQRTDGTKTYYMWSREKFNFEVSEPTYTDPKIDTVDSFISTWCLENDQVKVYGGNIAAGTVTAAQLSADAITSNNYGHRNSDNKPIAPTTTFPYSTAGTFLNLEDGAIYSKHFAIEGNGDGHIGGWDINQNGISKGDTVINSDDEKTSASLVPSNDTSPIRFATGAEYETITKMATKTDLVPGVNEVNRKLPNGGELMSVEITRVYAYATYDSSLTYDATYSGLEVNSANNTFTVTLVPPNNYNANTMSLAVQYNYTYREPKYNFAVLADGSLYANAASIAGTITATTGYIGYQDNSNVGWTIGANTISGGGVSLYTGNNYTDSDARKVRISVGDNSNLMSNPFRVFNDGYIIASNGKIGSCSFHTTKYPVVGEDLSSINFATVNTEYVGFKQPRTLSYQVRYSPSDVYSMKTFELYSSDNNAYISDSYAFTWYSAFTNSNSTPPSNYSDWTLRNIDDTSKIKTSPYLWFMCYVQSFKINDYGEYEYTDIDRLIYYIGDFSGYLTTFSFGDDSLRIGENIITGKTSSIKFEDDKGRLSGTWYYGSAEIATTSWRGIKSNIEKLDNRYSTLFDSLQPVRFTYNNGQSNRYHTGFILDELKDAMDEAKIDSSELAAYCVSDTVTGEGGIRYSEFIALCVDQTQRLKARTSELEARVAELEIKLEALATPQHD